MRYVDFVSALFYEPVLPGCGIPVFSFLLSRGGRDYIPVCTYMYSVYMYPVRTPYSLSSAMEKILIFKLLTCRVNSGVVCDEDQLVAL